MSQILIILVLLLVVADLATGRRHSHAAVLLNIVAVAGLPLLWIFLPEQFMPLLSGLFLLWQYLCLRLMILRYSHLRGPGGALSLQGCRRLAGYGVLYDLLTLATTLLVLLGALIAVSWVGGMYGTFVALPTALVFFVSLVGGDFATALEALGVGGGVGLVALGLVLLVWLLAAVCLCLFVSVPAVLGLRALFGCRRELGLSGGVCAGYVLFLLIPYVNLIPLLRLRRSCRIMLA